MTTGWRLAAAGTALYPWPATAACGFGWTTPSIPSPCWRLHENRRSLKTFLTSRSEAGIEGMRDSAVPGGTGLVCLTGSPSAKAPGYFRCRAATDGLTDSRSVCERVFRHIHAGRIGNGETAGEMKLRGAGSARRTNAGLTRERLVLELSRR